MGINSYKPEPSSLVNFLQVLRDEHGFGYSSINTARSALSLLIKFEATPAGQHPLVVEYMKGLEHLCPPKPRYPYIWDAGTVLNFLCRWSPCDHLDFKLLSYKLLMLILLATAQRIQSISKLNIDFLQIKGTKAIFSVGSKLKTSKPGEITKIEFREYPPNRSLCVLRYLREYLKRSSYIRNTRFLFISLNKPHDAVTSQTLAKWAKIVLKAAGIENRFSAHSTRAASTSSAFYQGVPMQHILKCANWKSAKTFADWYKKPIISESTFQEKVFDSHLSHN